MAKKTKEVAQPKTLIEKILKWSESDLTMWQRDAARRLFQTQAPDLSAQDYDDLYALMKAENGFGGASSKEPMPLTGEHLPAPTAGNRPVVLKAIRDLKHVNRIVAGQTLTFAPKGLTVIYGANGAGKSGYSRVMKRACRARDQAEPVHTDATDAAEQDAVPEATFDVEVDGAVSPVVWKLGDDSPDLLSSVAVFDGRCARVYLTAENDVAYLPYGLDVIESLAQKVLPRIETMLDREIVGLNVDITPFDHLRGATVVGKEIETLSEKTDEAKLRKLSFLDDAEVTRLATIKKTLVESDPNAKAKQVRLTGQRLTSLVQRMNATADKIGATAIARFKTLDDATVTAEQAAKLAAEAFRAGEQLLPGTGDPTWKLLFDAARKYSTQVAYPDHPFPHVDDGALCPLCQQELGDAGARMQRFEAFVKQDAGKKAEQTRKALSTAVQTLSSDSLSVQVDDALASELDTIQKDMSLAVKNFEPEAEACRQWIIEAIATHKWEAPKAITSDPRPALTAAANDLVQSAAALEAAADEENRKKLQIEHDEIAARSALMPSVNAVCAVVQNIKLKASLEKCRKNLKTTAISTKSKALASETVTAVLKAGLKNEFEALGVEHIVTKLNERTDKGKMKHKLLLDLPAAKKVDEILSEGEQRAVAIGAFLAELDLADHKGAVVFDDPVSSLDHQRKRKIAKRLAEKSSERQVVVLTHDIVFLNLLVEEVDKAKVDYITHWVERDATGRPGSIKIGDAPATSSAYRDTKRAKATLHVAEKLAGDERLKAIRHGMGELRTTIEEVVQQHLFKNVVGRWRENLMLNNLKSINWDIQLVDEIDSVMGELSRYFEGHSHSEEYAQGVPELADLKTMIERVDAIIKKAKPTRIDAPNSRPSSQTN